MTLNTQHRLSPTHNPPSAFYRAGHNSSLLGLGNGHIPTHPWGDTTSGHISPQKTRQQAKSTG